MGLKIGDKVKFVNEKGGGVITKILSSSRVNVAIEDGFEIPYLASDLVKIEAGAESSLELSNKDDNKSGNNINNQDLHLKKGYLLSKEPPGVYLGFVPSNQKLLVSGKLGIFFINHTEAELLFCIYLKDGNGNYDGKEYGIIESESKLHIDTIDREYTDEWEHGFIQILYYNYDNGNIIAPVNEEFKIKSQDFIKEDNYKNSAFFDDEKAFITKINLYNEQKPLFQKEVEPLTKPNEIIEAMLTKNKNEEKIAESFIDKHLIDDKSAEVDMHIWKLVEDYSRLKPNEMFKIQMDYFNKCLDSALAKKLSKVVFIHGVGNRTLIKEIRNKLEKEYPEIAVYDASIAKYGIGATEIDIPYNMKI